MTNNLIHSQTRFCCFLRCELQLFAVSKKIEQPVVVFLISLGGGNLCPRSLFFSLTSPPLLGRLFGFSSENKKIRILESY